MRRTEKGFTLMELMVVIVIVAILAAVAVPLYMNYVRDARTTEARGAIGAIITAEQTHFQQEGTYTADTTYINGKVDLSDVNGNWSFAVAVNGADGFTVTATGVAGRPTSDLTVSCAYTRGQPPVWTP